MKQCSVHRGPIRGKAHYWNKRPMCLRCYRYFTARVHLARAPKHSNPIAAPPHAVGWLRRLLLG